MLCGYICLSTSTFVGVGEYHPVEVSVLGESVCIHGDSHSLKCSMSQQHIQALICTQHTLIRLALWEQCNRVGVRLYPLRGCVSVTVLGFTENVVGSVCANLSV